MADAASVGRDLLNVPFPEMVLKLASAIAQGQYELDRESVENAKQMALADINFPTKDDPLTSLLALGFAPTFYQFANTEILVQMTITATEEPTATSTEKTVPFRWKLFVSTANARTQNQFTYRSEGLSKLTTRIVPVPPPLILQKRLEAEIDKKLPPYASAVVLDPTSVSLGVGKQKKITAEVRDQTNRKLEPQPPVTWTSSDASIVSVDSDGTVHGNVAGTATIQAFAAGLTSRAEVTVA